MSKRRVKPRGARGDRQPLSVLNQQVQTRAGTEWVVRKVTGSASGKDYRCPGCDHLIARATPHTVVWPVEKSIFSEHALDERRHWHSTCWSRS